MQDLPEGQWLRKGWLDAVMIVRRAGAEGNEELTTRDVENVDAETVTGLVTLAKTLVQIVGELQGRRTDDVLDQLRDTGLKFEI
jgi:hypothetical protein